MAFDYLALSPVGGKNKPGMSEVFVAPKSWFTTIAEAPLTGTVAGETVTITDDHVFASGKGFIKLPVNTRVTKLTGESGGEAGSATETWRCEAKIKGLKAETIEFNTFAIDDEWIVLIKSGDCQDDSVMQLGCECNGAEMKYTFDSGTQRDGSKEFTITFESLCNPNKYEGEITIKP